MFVVGEYDEQILIGWMWVMNEWMENSELPFIAIRVSMQHIE